MVRVRPDLRQGARHYQAPRVARQLPLCRPVLSQRQQRVPGEPADVASGEPVLLSCSPTPARPQLPARLARRSNVGVEMGREGKWRSTTTTAPDPPHVVAEEHVHEPLRTVPALLAIRLGQAPAVAGLHRPPERPQEHGVLLKSVQVDGRHESLVGEHVDEQRFVLPSHIRF